MRQRNDTGHVQDVMAWPTDDEPDRRPFTVGPGEEIDHPVLIGGFTSLEPPDPEQVGETAETPPQEDPTPTAKSARKSATKIEGGEPQ